MYDEFLASDLSDILTGSEVDFLSNDFVTEPFNSNDGRGGQNSKVEKAKAQCETQLTRLWLKSEIEHCGKLGKKFAIFEKLTITTRLFRILMEHINIKRSLESELQIDYICSIQILKILEVIIQKGQI